MNFFDLFYPFSTWKTGRVRGAKKKTPLLVEQLEDRVQPAAIVQTIDGTGNNLAHPTWGSASVDFLRTAAADYADGISTPGGTNRPDARTISNLLADQPADSPTNDRMMSAFIYAWGQFIDHDLDLTQSATPKTAFNIQVPTGDPEFDPNSTGTQVIPLSRSNFDTATGTSKTNPRQQIRMNFSSESGKSLWPMNVL